jgi:hypothetical protein
MHLVREPAHLAAPQSASEEKVHAEKAKKVLQRFPTRCTGTPIDARMSSTHNAASLRSKDVAVPGKKNFSSCPSTGIMVQKRRKGEC